MSLSGWGGVRRHRPWRDLLLVSVTSLFLLVGVLAALKFLGEDTNRAGRDVNICNASQPRSCRSELNLLLSQATPREITLLARAARERRRELASARVVKGVPGVESGKGSQGQTPRRALEGRSEPRSRKRTPQAASQPITELPPVSENPPVSEPPSGPTGPTQTQPPPVLEPLCTELDRLARIC